MPTTDAPDVLTSDAASPVATESLGRETAEVAALAASPGDATDAPPEEESFKQLLRDFVLGRSQNPDDMPGLRFYIVFAGMLVLALLSVVVVAALISFIRWVGLLFR